MDIKKTKKDHKDIKNLENGMIVNKGLRKWDKKDLRNNICVSKNKSGIFAVPNGEGVRDLAEFSNVVEKKNKKIIRFFIGIKKRFFTFAPRLRGSENG